MKREFQLPPDDISRNDISFLDNLELPWETVTDGGMQWVIIHNYPVAKGYHQQNVSVAIKIETGYPRTPLDMAYFFPALQRRDGRAIGAISFQPIDGKNFQRWSRHRTGQNPWRAGVDDLSTHIGLVSFWFEQEFLKLPNAVTT